VGTYGAPDVDMGRYRRVGVRVALQVGVIPPQCTRLFGDRRAKAMLVRLPDIDEQVRIVDEIEPLVTAVTSLRGEAARLRTVRAALLDAFLNREVDVSVGIDPEDEALEDLAPI
jgi:hypothetical protein